MVSKVLCEDKLDNNFQPVDLISKSFKWIRCCNAGQHLTSHDPMCGHLICPKGSQRNLKIFPIPLSVWAGGPSGSSSSGAWEERSLRLLSTRPGAREARGSLLLSIQLWAVYAVGRSVCCTCSVLGQKDSGLHFFAITHSGHKLQAQ